MGSLEDQIQQLKQSRHAVILAHNYQVGEVQDVADFVGDSLELTLKAKSTDAEVIVFCGVKFMAETAALLCPDKTVLMPDAGAGCPMANMVNAQQVRDFHAKYPGAAVVTYVNSNADVKAESDICCTSANAVKIVNSLPEDEIIFLPDQHLGAWVQKQTTKTIHIWKGFCPTHQLFVPERILELKAQNPGSVFLAHPECSPAILALADAVASTSGMSAYARDHAGPFIIGTEVGMLYRLQKENPDKLFIPASESAVCPNMKKTTLEKVLWSLQDMKTVVTVPAEIRERAHQSIERMLAVR
ncbi:quinolinate synthase [Candidatus Wirthbacteria bacterium CG2_30_54_11]|uniref:Quinolinate synthase n=1 Tax=Candidatus Wirthbacteria bacterium CG2_30_54_11 TaxID=1817892 RepID=A0A1J5J7C1_9BACT|nr:MAG: quinolinate synthase [Candidatus Wirthbacteria bacterium CG2_30_54_11]